jgi:hypothetical protein
VHETKPDERPVESKRKTVHSMQSIENLISDAEHPALHALEQILQQPIPHDDVATAYPVLVRASRRLNALRQSLAEVDETALAYANHTYSQLLSIVFENVGASAAAELRSLTGGVKPARSCAELRISTTGVYSWLADILNKIEIRTNTEAALGDSLSSMIHSSAEMLPAAGTIASSGMRYAGYI